MSEAATTLDYETLQPDPIPGQNGALRKQVVRGSAWTIVGFAASQCIRMASSFILTRLLLPPEFGLASLASLFVNALQQLSDLGVGPAVIQSKRGDEPEFLGTAWTLSIGRGLCLWLMTCAIAFPIGWVYRQQVSPRLLASLIIVIGFNAVMSGFNSTAMYTLNRRLRLEKLTILSIAAQVVGIVVTIAVACRYPSAWAIVLGGNATGIFTLCASHLIMKDRRDRLKWDPKAFHELFHFGKWIFVSTLFTFFANEIDRPLLARLGTLSTLGIYSLSLTLVRIPIDLISRLSSQTLYPALARSAEAGTARLSDSVLKARRLLLAVGVAIMLGLALGAPLFFNLLYTKVWQDAGWIAQFMAIGIWATILQLTADRALLVLGQSRALAFSNMVNFITTAVGCIAGQYAGTHYFNHNWGLQGFILGVASGNFTGHIVIELALWAHGIRIYRQDLAYTGLLIGLTATGMGLPLIFQSIYHGVHAAALSDIFPIVIVVITCCWAMERAWRFVAK